MYVFTDSVINVAHWTCNCSFVLRNEMFGSLICAKTCLLQLLLGETGGSCSLESERRGPACVTCCKLALSFSFFPLFPLRCFFHMLFFSLPVLACVHSPTPGRTVSITYTGHCWNAPPIQPLWGGDRPHLCLQWLPLCGPL